MGPPTAVPLRDVSCVMILLHLSLLLSLPPFAFPQALTSGKTLKCVRSYNGNMEQYISKQGKRICMCVHADTSWCAAGRGGKRPGSLPGTPWLSDLWRPHCTSSSSSMQQDVCFPPCWQPNQGERRVAELPWYWPYPSPAAETPGCYPTLRLNFSSPQTQLLSTKRGKEKPCRSSQTHQKGCLSLCLPSLILYCMSSIWQMLLFWKTADIESAVSDFTANSHQACVTPNVISQFVIERRHKCYICCLLMLCVRKILRGKSTERALNVI